MHEPLTVRTIESTEEHWRLGLCDCSWHNEGIQIVAELRALADKVMEQHDRDGHVPDCLEPACVHARRVLGKGDG